MININDDNLFISLKSLKFILKKQFFKNYRFDYINKQLKYIKLVYRINVSSMLSYKETFFNLRFYEQFKGRFSCIFYNHLFNNSFFSFNLLKYNNYLENLKSIVSKRFMKKILTRRIFVTNFFKEIYKKEYIFFYNYSNYNLSLLNYKLKINKYLKNIIKIKLKYYFIIKNKNYYKNTSIILKYLKKNINLNDLFLILIFSFWLNKKKKINILENKEINHLFFKVNFLYYYLTFFIKIRNFYNNLIFLTFKLNYYNIFNYYKKENNNLFFYFLKQKKYSQIFIKKRKKLLLKKLSIKQINNFILAMLKNGFALQQIMNETKRILNNYLYKLHGKMIIGWKLKFNGRFQKRGRAQKKIIFRGKNSVVTNTFFLDYTQSFFVLKNGICSFNTLLLFKTKYTYY